VGRPHQPMPAPQPHRAADNRPLALQCLLGAGVAHDVHHLQCGVRILLHRSVSHERGIGERAGKRPGRSPQGCRPAWRHSKHPPCASAARPACPHRCAPIQSLPVGPWHTRWLACCPVEIGLGDSASSSGWGGRGDKCTLNLGVCSLSKHPELIAQWGRGPERPEPLPCPPPPPHLQLDSPTGSCHARFLAPDT